MCFPPKLKHKSFESSDATYMNLFNHQDLRSEKKHCTLSDYKEVQQYMVNILWKIDSYCEI